MSDPALHQRSTCLAIGGPSTSSCMTVTRREALAGAAAVALTAAAPPPDSLDALARAKGMRFGTAVAGRNLRGDHGSFADADYARLIRAECGLIVPENEMKWRFLRPDRDRFSFERLDEIVEWARREGLAMRGHNLLWHQPRWLPDWLDTYPFGPQPRAEAERLLVTHIATILQRYGARIGGYDVVNEAVRPEDGTLYETSLSRAFGGAEPTLDLAFRTARRYAPRAQLVYNDYMSWEPGNERHRAGVLKLLEGFRRRDVPVDALGLQSHLVTQGPQAGASVLALQREWRRFLDAVVEMDYALLVTELDVRDNGLGAAIGPRDRAVADFTRGYLDVTLSYPRLRDVLSWGLSDRFSWIDGFEPRRDGLPRRPTLYDAAFRPKPMRDAVAAAFIAAPAR